MCVCICFLPAHILKQKGLSVFRIEKAFYFWYPMSLLCDFQIHINCLHTFYVNEEVLSAYCGRLKKIIEQERRRSQINYSGIEIGDFPGGPYGFELITRFCYSNNSITITVANVSLLHCCAVFLGMTEKISTNNLLKQTETFLEGMFDWSWRDLLVCLKSCESFFDSADSSGLIDKLIYGVLAKIAQNSDIATSSSSSSSPETHRSFRVSSSSFKNTPEALKPSSSSRAWWFDDVSILPPKIIDRLIQSLGAYGTDNNSLILTRFLLHYLKVVSALQGKKNTTTLEFGGLADTAVHGVVLVGSKVFSCRSLFWVLRIVSGFGLSKEYRLGLERLIGEMLDEATLDDLLVSGHDRGGVYDVNLVIRLIRVFSKSEGVSLQKLKKVGRLIDKYLGEISPDQNLKMSKFLGVAESLPDSARDCYDGAYRAIDIYLESHPTLSFEERSRLCRCLNYEKLSLEACKELAKNPKIPPRVAIQALMSQQSKALTGEEFAISGSPTSTTASAGHHFHQSHFHSKSHSQMIVYNKGSAPGVDEDILAEDSIFDSKLNLQRMQWRVVELEKLCREMKGQMSRMVKNNNVLSSSTPSHGRTLPRLC